MARQRLRWTRTTGQRVVLGINVALIVALAVGALGVAYAAQKLSAVERLDVAPSLTKAPTSTIVSAEQIEVAPAGSTVPGQTTTTAEFVVAAPDIEENYLIVGSDNAERIAEGSDILSGREEEATNHLADTIMILRLRPAAGTASLISIPRDLEVQIAGTTRSRRINSAFNLDDPAARVTRLIDTVEENLDITLQHYVEVDLEGFRRLVDAIGGVAVCFDGPSRDRGSGLVVGAGWTDLQGDQALAYVRSRKLEVQNIDGVWENASPRADLDRIERQQAFVRSTVAETFADVVSDPRVLISLLNIASEELVVSNTFSVIGDGSDLAAWFREFSEESLETMSLDVFDLPVTSARNNEFRLGMLSSAETQLDIFRGIAPTDVVPKRVEVSLRGPRSERGAIADGLEALGFELGSQGAGGETPGVTQVSYGLGGHNAANLVAAFLDGDTEFLISEDLSGNEITVVLGEEIPTVIDRPRVLEVGARPVAVPPTTSGPVEAATTTTTTEPRYEFDCSQPRA